jgi:hypothetical protein
MIIKTQTGSTFDTDRDLTAPERHVLQKLFAWSSLASSLEQFRQKRDQALEKGWNNSGPVRPSTALRAITRDLETKLRQRISRIEPVYEKGTCK